MELYVHLPFCARKCRYCDFASYAGREGDIPGYVDDLITEMRRASQRLARPGMDTAFLGGGTPSLLPAPQLDRILRSARECFSFSPDAECTSEANPGTLTEAAYGDEIIYERHRHRFEFNNAFREKLTECGLVIGGTLPNGRLVEIVELPKSVHPWFVGTQFHPEFKSRPTNPHPLFRDFVAAALKRKTDGVC